MRFIISFLFFGPFWVQLIAAGGLAYLGIEMRADSAAKHEAVLAQLAQPAPAAIPIDAFSGANPAEKVQEVALVAQHAYEHNTRIITRKNGIKVGEKLMVVLVSPEAAADETVASAVIVFLPSQKDKVFDWLLQQATDMGAAGPVLTVKGLVGSGPSGSGVTDALRDQGMKKASNFIFIDPFLDGREAGYQARLKEVDDLDGMPVFLAATLLALIGIGKLLWRARQRQTQERRMGDSLASLSTVSAAAFASAATQGSTSAPVSPQAAGFASWSATPAAAQPAAPRGEVLTAPPNISLASLERIANREARPRPSFPIIMTVIVVIGWTVLQLGGGNLGQVSGSLPVDSFLADLATSKPPTPPAAAPEAAAAPDLSPEGPLLMPLAVATGIGLLLFILLQRRKANRF